MKRLTVFKLREGVSLELASAWEAAARAIPQHVPSVKRVFIEKNLNGGEWTYVQGMEFHRLGDNARYSAHPYHTEVLSGLYRRNGEHVIFGGVVEICFSDSSNAIASTLREPIRGPLWRGVMMKVRDGAPAEKVAEMETRLAAIPSEIEGVRNSYVARAIEPLPKTKWTHTFEHEYENWPAMDAYNQHPFHKEKISPFFKLDHPDGIIEKFCVAWCQMRESFLWQNDVP